MTRRRELIEKAEVTWLAARAIMKSKRNGLNLSLRFTSTLRCGLEDGWGWGEGWIRAGFLFWLNAVPCREKPVAKMATGQWSNGSAILDGSRGSRPRRPTSHDRYLNYLHCNVCYVYSIVMAVVVFVYMYFDRHSALVWTWLNVFEQIS